MSVKCQTGKVIDLRFDPGRSIADVKSMLEKQLAVSVSEQRLSLAGATLHNGRTLSECNVEHNSTLHLYTLPFPSNSSNRFGTLCKQQVGLFYRDGTYSCRALR